MATDLITEATRARHHPEFILLPEEGHRGLPWNPGVGCRSPCANCHFDFASWAVSMEGPVLLPWKAADTFFLCSVCPLPVAAPDLCGAEILTRGHFVCVVSCSSFPSPLPWPSVLVLPG